MTKKDREDLEELLRKGNLGLIYVLIILAFLIILSILR